MFYLPSLVGTIVLAGLVVFFWQRYGPRSGWRFGRRIAAHMGVPNKVFHALLENGVKASSRELLTTLERSTASLDEASAEVAPVLRRGMERLEARFGRQSIYEAAKPAVARFIEADDKARTT